MLPDQLRVTLISNSNETIRKSGSRFFKEEIKLYGIKTKIVSDIGKDFFREIKHLSKSEIFSLCEELWKSGYMEESFIASQWIFAIRKQFQPEDFQYFDRWVNLYVKNWASCDTFCNHAVGDFIMKYPEFIANLKQWAHSPNLWMRRAAAVSLIVPAREGKLLKEIFEIAEILLTDKEDLVQKGYGWMLKAASRLHEEEVFTFVMDHKKEMPRTALRYAIEKMDAGRKEAAMARQAV